MDKIAIFKNPAKFYYFMLIIFDLDDTLYVSKRFNKTKENIIIGIVSKHLRTSKKDALKKFYHLKDKLKRDGEKFSTVHVFIKLGLKREDWIGGMNREDPQKYVKFNQSVYETLKELSKEHKLVVYSNSSKLSVYGTLTVLKIKKFFKKIYYAENFEESKPNADAFKKILKDNNCKPKDALSVGDSIYKDLLPAKKIGIKTVWISKNTHEQQNGVDYIIKNIKELPVLLEKKESE